MVSANLAMSDHRQEQGCPFMSHNAVPAAAMPRAEADSTRREARIEQLIGRLPQFLHCPIRWLRRPEARWLRIPAGLFFILGGFAAILPVFGLWMLPLGLLLLAEEVPALRRASDRLLAWIERRSERRAGRG
jgi:hypothetical protein